MSKAIAALRSLVLGLIVVCAAACKTADGEHAAGTGTGGSSAPIAAGTGGTNAVPVPAGTGGAAGGTAGMGAAPSATFTMIYNNVIVSSGCLAGPACHSAPAGNLRMIDQATAYMSLVGVAAMGMNTMGGTTNCADTGMQRVKPGDPDNSLLVQKLSGTPPCGVAMPPGGMLTPEKLMLIRTWIQNGANND